MNQKFIIDQYEVCTNFKSDNALAISAEYLPTGQYFGNEAVQLMRIKRQTVFATLQRKSEKNLRCEFQQIFHQGVLSLVIKFIINFDFLPEFSEQIHLDILQKKDSIKSIQVNNFKADIQSLQKLLDVYQKDGVWKLHDIGGVTSSTTQPVQVKTLQLGKGRYLLKVSGIYTCSIATNGTNDKITFRYSLNKNKALDQKSVRMNSHSGYSYPFSFQQVIQGDGQFRIQAFGTYGQWNMTNLHLILSPIAETK